MHVKPPSATQADVLRRLAPELPLVHWPGGFWTVEGTPAMVYAEPARAAARKTPVAPEWWVGVQTVRSMERRGWLVRTGWSRREWDDSRVLTDLGRRIAQTCKETTEGAKKDLPAE